MSITLQDQIFSRKQIKYKPRENVCYYIQNQHICILPDMLINNSSSLCDYKT